jgi:hypothetical protein
VVDSVEATAPTFFAVSVIEKVVPGARTGAAGVVNADVSVRSARVTLTAATPEAARQLFVSTVSVTTLVSSAQASTT